jgi:uncharacterized protein
MATRRDTRPLVALSVLLTLVTACGSTAASRPPTISARGLPLGDAVLQHPGHTGLHLIVEIADNGTTQATGLMGVRHLATDQGEAFVFPSSVTDGFWMKDTLIPLDIAFVDAQGRVVDVQHMVPCMADPCTVYYAREPYSTALETDAGVLTRAGITVGDPLSLTRRSPARSATP